jgi:peptidoglycan/LPS O-acetylase OafA/YrhL
VKAGARGIVETEYYSYIDGLRGVAILMVVLVHVQGVVAPPRSAAVAALVASGARGVQLFFMLSAFTLYSSLIQRFDRETKPVLSFYVRRAFRILPVWWCAVLIYFFARQHIQGADFGTRPSVQDLVLHGTFTYGFSPEHINSLVSGGWSLFSEETFYLLLPLVRKNVLSLAAAARFTAGLILLAVVWIAGTHVFFRDPIARQFVFFFPLSQWFLFGLGIVWYYVVRAVGDLRVDRWVVLLFDLFCAAVAYGIFAGDPHMPYQFSAACVFFCVGLATSQSRSWWRRAIDNRLLRLFGRCCYSIYLFHRLVLYAVDPLRAKLFALPHLASLGPGGQLACWFVVFSLGCLAGGLVLFYGFEKPMVLLGRRIIARVHAWPKRSAAPRDPSVGATPPRPRRLP